MIIFAIIVLCVNFVLWFVLFKTLKKTFSAKGVLSEIKQEAEKIIIEINRETDNSVTIMESKINQIKEIIDTVEKKMMIYDKNLFQKENEKQIYQKLSDSQLQQNSTPMKKAVKKYKSNSTELEQEYLPLFTENAGTSDFYELKNNSTKELVENLEKEKEINDSKENFEIIQGEEIKPTVPVQDKIIKLAKEGFSPELIASKLGISINVVTMTIDLYL